MKEYVVTLEPGADGGWSAHLPDVPRLGVVGYPTRDEAVEAVRQAFALYVGEG